MMLKDLRVASPCQARWETMVGDDRTRFCGACKKNVHNLSAMTEAEASALLRGSAADGHPPCVRFYQRADGTVLTADCPVGVRLAERARRRMAAVAAMAIAIFLNFLGVRAVARNGAMMGAPVPQRPVETQPDPGELMGEVAVEEPTPAPTPVPTPPKKKK